MGLVRKIKGKILLFFIGMEVLRANKLIVCKIASYFNLIFILNFDIKFKLLIQRN